MVKHNLKKLRFFIAHMGKNEPLASWLQKILELHDGVEVFIFEDNRFVRPGDATYINKIVKNLDVSDHMLILWDEDAKLSPWVNQEAGRASGKDVDILVINLDGTRQDGIITTANYYDMRKHTIGNLTDWILKLIETDLKKQRIWFTCPKCRYKQRKDGASRRIRLECGKCGKQTTWDLRLFFPEEYNKVCEWDDKRRHEIKTSKKSHSSEPKPSNKKSRFKKQPDIEGYVSETFSEYEVQASNYIKVTLGKIPAGARIRGTLIEVDRDLFDFDIVSEKNLVKCLNREKHDSIASGKEKPAYFISEKVGRKDDYYIYLENEDPVNMILVKVELKISPPF